MVFKGLFWWYISGISRMNFVNVLIIVFFIKSIESFHETTLTKFETCSHKVILAGAPSPPPFPQEHLPLSTNQSPPLFGSVQSGASEAVT